MASWRARGAEPEDDFDEFDPTPYGGGYDLSLTYGRPLPPSDEICHPLSSAGGGDVDYNRPHYSSGSTTSVYETEGDFGDRYGRSRPKPQPTYGFQPHQEEEIGGFGGRPEPQPTFGFQPHQEEEVSGFGGGYGGGRRPQPPRPEYGAGGGEGEYGSGQGFGLGGRREEEEPRYGRRPERQEEHGFGSGYGEDRPKPYGEEGVQGYGYGSKYGGGGEYRRSEEEAYGGGPKPYGEEGGQGYGSGSKYGGGGRYQRSEEESYGGGHRRGDEYGYGGKPSYERPSYGGDDEERTGRPSHYGEEQGEKYGRPKYVSLILLFFPLLLPLFLCVDSFISSSFSHMLQMWSSAV